MGFEKDVKTETIEYCRDFQENTSNLNYFVGVWMARGAGFEPARPKGPQT